MRNEAFYRQLILAGESPMIADMLASRRAPGCKTDTAHSAGAGTLDKQLGNDAEYICRQAQKRGYKPVYTDIYDAQAARFPGDPEAFHKAHESRAHIRRICKKRGWGFSGTMDVAPADTPPAPDVPLANSLIRELAGKEAAVNPEFAKASKGEQRDIIVKKHGAKKRVSTT